MRNIYSWPSQNNFEEVFKLTTDYIKEQKILKK